MGVYGGVDLWLLEAGTPERPSLERKASLSPSVRFRSPSSIKASLVEPQDVRRIPKAPTEESEVHTE